MSRLARERYLLHDPPQTYLTFEWLAQLDFVNLPLKIYQRQQSFHTIWIQAILVSTVISFQCILFVAKVKIKTLGITVRINVVNHWVLFICWMWAVVTLENEIGNGPLTLILKSCGVDGWNPWTSSFLLHSLPLTSSHLLLNPPSYSTLLPNLLLTPLTSSWRVSDD